MLRCESLQRNHDSTRTLVTAAEVHEKTVESAPGFVKTPAQVVVINPKKPDAHSSLATQHKRREQRQAHQRARLGNHRHRQREVAHERLAKARAFSLSTKGRE